MRIVGTRVLDRVDAGETPYVTALSSPCVLDLQRSLRGWRSLSRVVCLPGYPLSRDISWTVVSLLADSAVASVCQ